MSKRRYRPWNPDQMVLFPQAMRDALDEGHIVFRIMDVVETLDIGCITERLEREIREFSEKAKEIDVEEDKLYGKGQEVHKMSEELKLRSHSQKCLLLTFSEYEFQKPTRAKRERLARTSHRFSKRKAQNAMRFVDLAR